jgi:hypothetical protein
LTDVLLYIILCNYLSARGRRTERFVGGGTAFSASRLSSDSEENIDDDDFGVDTQVDPEQRGGGGAMADLNDIYAEDEMAPMTLPRDPKGMEEAEKRRAKKLQEKARIAEVRKRRVEKAFGKESSYEHAQITHDRDFSATDKAGARRRLEFLPITICFNYSRPQSVRAESQRQHVHTRSARSRV